MDELKKFIKTAYALLKSPNFKLGDWVICDGATCKIESIYVAGVRESNGVEYEASKASPVYLLRVMERVGMGTEFSPSSLTKFAYARQISYYIDETTDDDDDDNSIEEKQFDFETCSFVKLSSGELLVYGIFSSYYIDVDDDILTSTSHKYFVKGVNSGVFPYPDIYIAHTPVAVGKLSMIDYHTDGFAVFGGKIDRAWSQHVELIIAKSLEKRIQLGLSHGFMGNTVKYDDEGFITQYVSHEISILPLFSVTIDGKRTVSASNKYTALLSTGED